MPKQRSMSSFARGNLRPITSLSETVSTLWYARVQERTLTRFSTRTKSLFRHQRAVWNEMTWGQGLTQALDAAGRALKTLKGPSPNPNAIVVSWSGNDAVGPGGYTDNPAALPGWATNTNIVERDADSRHRLTHLAMRLDVLQFVALVPTDHEAYGLAEPYQVQMQGHARVLGRRSKVTAINPQTLISNTSRIDRAHTDDTKINRRRYIHFFAAAAGARRRAEKERNPLVPFGWRELALWLVSLGKIHGDHAVIIFFF